MTYGQYNVKSVILCKRGSLYIRPTSAISEAQKSVLHKLLYYYMNWCNANTIMTLKVMK